MCLMSYFFSTSLQKCNLEGFSMDLTGRCQHRQRTLSRHALLFLLFKYCLLFQWSTTAPKEDYSVKAKLILVPQGFMVPAVSWPPLCPLQGDVKETTVILSPTLISN